MKCQICTHLRRDEIEEHIKRGDALLKLEAEWGIGKSVFSRHRSGHVKFDPDEIPTKRIVNEVAANSVALRNAVSETKRQVTLDLNMMRTEIVECLEDLTEMRKSLTKKNVIEKLSTVQTIIRAIEMVLKNAAALGIDLSSEIDQHEVIVQMPERVIQ